MFSLDQREFPPLLLSWLPGDGEPKHPRFSMSDPTIVAASPKVLLVLRKNPQRAAVAIPFYESSVWLLLGFQFFRNLPLPRVVFKPCEGK